MDIHVASLDYDDCLYTKAPQKMQDYMDENQSIISFIQQTQAQCDKKIMFVGSNRQSLLLDAENGMDSTGSCFTAIDYISIRLGALFDRFTLSDIYLDMDSGHNISLFLQEVYKKGWQEQVLDFDKFWDLKENWRLKPLFDLSSSKFFAEDKINILYAQIHKVAADHPDDRIVFDFFDDRMDILEYLHTFFRKYPALIPNHVTLRLFQYQANVVTPMGEHTQNTDSTLSLNHGINGRGLIDIDYRQTVKNMGVLAEQLQPLKRGGYIMSNYITPELLDGMRLEKSTAFASQPGYGSSDLGFFQTALKSEVPVAQGCDHAQYRCTSLDKRA